MSDRVEVLVIGYENTVLQTTLSMPVSQKQCSSATAMAHLINAPPNSIHYILVLLGLIGEDIKLKLQEFQLKKRVIKIFNCNSKNSLLVHGHQNVVHISSLLVTYEITYSIIAFLTAQLVNYPRVFEVKVERRKQIEGIKSWLAKSHQIETCHILLTPFNVTFEHLFQTRDALTRMCNKMFDNRIQIKVFTIYDYIPQRDHYHEQAEHMTSFGHRQLSNISHILSEFGGMHMVLVGNEVPILDDRARIIIAKQKDNTLPSTASYEHRCTLIANEQYEELSKKVTEKYLSDIKTWQLQDRTPKTLEDLENDESFKSSLFIVHKMLESNQQEMNTKFRHLMNTFLENTLKPYEDSNGSAEVDEPNGMPEGYEDPIGNQIQMDPHLN